MSVPGLAHSIDQLEGVEMHVMGTRDRADPGAAERWGPRVQAFDNKGPQALQYARDLYVTYVDEDLLIIRDASGVPEVLVRKEKTFSKNWGTDPPGEDE